MTSPAPVASAASGSSAVTSGTSSPASASTTATNPQSSATTPIAAAPTVTASVGVGAALSAGGPLALSQAETAQATFLAMTQFTQTLLDPAIDGRGADATPALTDQVLQSYAMAPSDRTRGGVGRDVYEAFYGKMGLSSSSNAPRWNVWTSGFGSSQVSSNNAAPGSSSSSRIFATVVGADYSLSPQTRLGFAMAGGGTNFAGSSGSGRSDLFQAGAFARHAIGQAYVATALAYGWQAMTGDHPGVDQLNAAFNANAYSARIESGYRFATPWLGVTAYAAGQFMTFNLPTSAAQPSSANAFATALGSDRINDSRSELGFRTSTSLALHDGIVNLRARVAWAHDFTAAEALPAALKALPGLGYVASGAALAPNSALVGGTIELKWLNSWVAAGTFDGELSSQVRSYTGKATMRYAW
ncbi:autotransporter outer membrane beta-barrel domain-containing protein [Bradyrhizobium sp. CCGB20]|uniref:autotransporter outer membrane beta-barrel domain-containing protein n=1 Tax=Bradyrhizobium sp. CCGB20 TaxID=2949633 RepID=UPI0020B3CCCE|nr:autotransporter outer membrane beta-barrel domain-containing protein [Bradyrhizobium sp. CCGB20]MCP3399898.1 autotransporter outer membrane beta-barrel domain-containing protein [Bradyrhizobium sp. CCGB20]